MIYNLAYTTYKFQLKTTLMLASFYITILWVGVFFNKFLRLSYLNYYDIFWKSANFFKGWVCCTKIQWHRMEFFFRQNHMLMIYKNTFCLKFLYSSLFEIWKKDQPIANIELCNLGTYFNCIMFMVASSVVTTIMILNYHHRLADTHEMPPWVSTL